MGAAEKRQVLARVKLEVIPIEVGLVLARKWPKRIGLWVWQVVNEVWHYLFYASVVRKVGPGSEDIVIRNSPEELRHRY
ncbi:MAG: hypothetical protein H6624_02725 [Bdellovibrionaceae bacterium]|nr:hypothetical protein [Bdellovibrionales bacterium]MCB9083226.1 hypothetical protein [Pseudobdellovibrionaceae bacterium]